MKWVKILIILVSINLFWISCVILHVLLNNDASSFDFFGIALDRVFIIDLCFLLLGIALNIQLVYMLIEKKRK